MSQRDYTTPETIHPERRKRPPMQPMVVAKDGCTRFQANRLVVALLDAAGKHGLDLNWMCSLDAPRSDWEQFAQLIGYSISGFSELSYVRDATYERAAEKAAKVTAAEPPAVPQGRGDGGG